MREVRFTQAARKHRVSNGRARQIIDDPLGTLTLAAPEPGMDDRIVFIGDDDSGRALEIIAVDLPEYLLVIHAQDLQAKFRPHYDRAKEQERWMKDTTPTVPRSTWTTRRSRTATVIG
jgi:hypothetical protein